MLIPIGGISSASSMARRWARRCSALAPLAFLQELRGSQLREGEAVSSRQSCFTVVMSLFYNLRHLRVFTLMGAVRATGVTASLRIILPTSSSTCARAADLLRC